MRLAWRLTVYAFAMAFFGGCGWGSGPERVVVSGTVTYNGKPIPEGLIRFAPIQESSVPVGGATITEGEYRADARGGVPVGTHKVQIQANRLVNPGKPVNPDEELHPGLYQYIPEKYNAKTQLEITVPPGSRPITKNFELVD